MLLSVIVPCYNEEGNIDLFYDETVKALGDLMPDTELIFVNDGSRDASGLSVPERSIGCVWSAFRAISARKLPSWQVCRLRRELLPRSLTRICSRIPPIFWK